MKTSIVIFSTMKSSIIMRASSTDGCSHPLDGKLWRPKHRGNDETEETRTPGGEGSRKLGRALLEFPQPHSPVRGPEVAGGSCQSKHHPAINFQRFMDLFDDGSVEAKTLGINLIRCQSFTYFLWLSGMPSLRHWPQTRPSSTQAKNFHIIFTRKQAKALSRDCSRMLSSRGLFQLDWMWFCVRTESSNCGPLP